jgi:hypothetical protein
MTNLGRWLVAMPAIVVLAGCVLLAAQRGRADNLAYDASIEIGTWAAAGKQPGVQTWQWVHTDLERAAQILPRDPIVQELLGVLLGGRYDAPELIRSSENHFIAALTARPTSGYTWANLVEVRYQQGRTDAQFESALRNAARFGPSEPEVQRTIANLGLAVFDEVAPETRIAIEAAIAAGMRRNAPEIMQISERRGRLDVACRHPAKNQSSAHQKWFQLCPSREQIL